MNIHIPQCRPEKVRRIHERYGISLLLATILDRRGVEEKDLVNYLEDEFVYQHSPFLVEDVFTACDRIDDAIREGESIFIFGDRDVDGITSTAIIYKTLKKLSAKNVHYRLPEGDESYGLSDAIVSEVLSGGYRIETGFDPALQAIAVLPEPMVTVAKSKNPDLVVALDLTAEWDKVSEPGSLVQGCVVVRKDFAAQNITAVQTFLSEYGASIEALTTDVEGTAAKIEAQGIFAKAAVAAKAIPNCNVCFITDAEMQTALSRFLTIMHGVAPASVGGSIPGEDFYCVFNG